MKSVLIFLLLVVSFSVMSQTSIHPKYLGENHFIPDQGTGFYMNLIFPGNYGNLSIVRVEGDKYMSFSQSNGMALWHSKDMVNWESLVRHRLPEVYNRVWTVDLQYFKDIFHLYMLIQQYPARNVSALGTS